jgi:PrgI family protein
MTSEPGDQQPLHARVPADVDAPDKVIYGLTFRQLAILAAAATVLYIGWRAAGRLLPAPVLLAASVVAGGLVVGVAVGRRDGLPLDVWLASAVRYRRAPRASSTTDTAAGTPPWVAAPRRSRVPLPAPLRLPADAIAADGEITLPAGRTGTPAPAAVVAATTVNLALRTPAEQTALVEAFGRWLNSLTTPTQIVVAATPVDLPAHARALAEAARRLPHPALEAACADHARFLTDLAAIRDPLRRQVLLVCRAAAGEPAGGHAARRHAEDTARALSGLGVTTRALDGAQVTAALAAAADPYRPPRPGGLAAPDAVLTARTPPAPATTTSSVSRKETRR